ncbi:nucleophile aminohydrolase [Diplogelasinospora grovesii]|uniref:Nucleophile aminohydrolase n=1 Tax=Diplogelasinospora grovesii TaxID=303347 RepID=A0AAN6NDJ1_9PEZI|nr:nucleophile aminohydrolase [Diplogelasinospora grovesii]
MAWPPHNDNFSMFPSRRSVVHSTQGMVCTISPLANEAALSILRKGGNAADAAVAAAAVLNLVDPSMTGIGGDVFCLFYEAKSRKVHALNGSGRSPAAATLDDICRDLNISDTDRASSTIPNTSALSVTVPGAAAAWVDIVGLYGSGDVTLEQVLAPAVGMAREGVPVSEIASYYWQQTELELLSKPNGRELLKAEPNTPWGHRAPRPGELYRNPLLAQTFERLGAGGKRGFYEGSVAEAIVEAARSQGGYLTLEDMRRYGREGSEVTKPVPFRLRTGQGELDLWEHPPNGQGIVAQMALGILQSLEKEGKVPEFGPKDHNSPEYLHALIESLKIAFADGSWYITDPDTTPPHTTQSLLSEEYLAERAKLFDPETVNTTLEHGSLTHKVGDTIYLAVTDSEENACSFVNSVADTFGSRIVPKGVGFVLQNRGAGFHLGPEGHPNIYAPGKRPYNTIIPALVTAPPRDALVSTVRHTAEEDVDKDECVHGDLHTVLGVMGGAMQPQGHVQVLLNMLWFGMNPQVALDAPRICIGVSLPGKSTDPSKKVDRTVYLEEGIPDAVADELRQMGHEVKMVKGMGRALFGRGQVITVNKDPVGGERVYSAGSDMRGDGAAAPFIPWL